MQGMDQSTNVAFAKKTITSVSTVITTALVIIVDILLGYFTFKLFQLGYVPLAVVFILIIATPFFFHAIAT